MDFLIGAGTLLGGLFLKTEKLNSRAEGDLSVLDLRGWGLKQNSFIGPFIYQVGQWRFEAEVRDSCVQGWKVSEMKDGNWVETYYDDPWLRDSKGEAHVIFF